MDFSHGQRPGTGAANTCMLAVVRVRGQLVGIEGRHVVQAIVVPAAMTAVPRRAGGIVGVVSHGAQLVPVVDLQRWLAVPDDAEGIPETAPETTRDARIVVMSHDGQVVGLLVDAVIGLERCAIDAVQRLFHDDRPDELFERAALLDPAEPALALLDPARLAALAGTWCAAAEIEVGSAAPSAPVSGSNAAGDARRRGKSGASGTSGASVSHGVFRIGDTLVGIPADAIGELLRVPALRPPPYRRPGSHGLCDWRGQLLPVVDLTPALQAAPDSQPAPWLCVVRHGELALGVLVHENFGLTPIEASRLDAARASGADGANGTDLARCEIPIEQGILRALDPQALMAHCPESALSARRDAAVQRTASARSAKPYMVFEAEGIFAAEVSCVQEVLPLPDATRARLGAGLPASISWRGHAVPVRDVLATPGQALPAERMRQLIILTHGERRLAVPIAGVQAMIPARAGTLCRLVVNGREVDVVSTETSAQRASYALVDLGAHVRGLGSVREIDHAPG